MSTTKKYTDLLNGSLSGATLGGVSGVGSAYNGAAVGTAPAQNVLVNAVPNANANGNTYIPPQTTVTFPGETGYISSNPIITTPSYLEALPGTQVVNPQPAVTIPNVNASNMTNVMYKDAVNDPKVPTVGNTSGMANSGNTVVEEEIAKNTPVATTPTTTPTTAPKLSYEEWLLAQHSNAATAYDRSVAAAEAQRQRAIHSAGGSYQQALSQYGSNAAAMSAMGLTGSGYTQYLDSQALAQKQGAINAANATYQDALLKAEDNRLAAENEANGLYAEYLYNEQLRKEQAEKDAAAKAEQNAANRLSAFNTLYDNIGSMSANDIERLGKANGLDEEQIAVLKEARSEYVNNALKGDDGYTKTDLDNLKDSGEIGEDTYNDLLGGISANIDTSSNQFYVKDEDTGKTTLMPYSEALANYNTLVQAGVDSDTLKAIKASMDSVYNAKMPSSTITFKKDNHGTTGTAGNEIKVTYNNSNYTLAYNGNEGEMSSVANSSSIADNTVFMLNNVLCIRHGNKYYELKAGAHTPNSYNTIKDAFN